MKDFALQLEGCSKADRKKVIKAAKSVGYKWYDDDRFMDKDWHHLTFSHTAKNFHYYERFHSSMTQPYTMPQDWDAIQEALGIEPVKRMETVCVQIFTYDYYCKRMEALNIKKENERHYNCQEMANSIIKDYDNRIKELEEENKGLKLILDSIGDHFR